MEENELVNSISDPYEFMGVLYDLSSRVGSIIILLDSIKLQLGELLENIDSIPGIDTELCKKNLSVCSSSADNIFDNCVELTRDLDRVTVNDCIEA